MQLKTITKSLPLIALLGLAACDMSGIPENDALEVALVDFGNGQEEIFFEEVDGMAVYQDDMILGPVEWVREGNFKLKLPETDPNAPVAAAGLAHLSAWHNGRIPFRIDTGDFPNGSLMRNRINSAINHWNQNTLIQLVPASGSEHHVRFEFKSGVCQSAVGRQLQFGPQKISLSSGCDTGAIIHEIGHTVGFFHEQTRADRDSRIVINWDNIQKGKEHNFYTYLLSGFVGLDFGAYDTSSIMHYDSFAFADDTSKPTIVRADCDPNSSNLEAKCLINANRTALSSRDKKAATRQVTGDPFVKFKLRNEANNRCLRPRSGTTAEGAAVITSTCANTSSRRWYLWSRPGMSGDLLVNQNSRLCLQRANSGNGMVQMPCTGGSAQRFHFESGGFLRGEKVRRTGSQQCLRRLSSQSQTIQSTSCTNTSSRRWFRDYL